MASIHSARKVGPMRGTRRGLTRERGTVLLMVIGVLALMAIIAVVYATLGRAERSASAALDRAQKNDVVSQEIARHIADTISDGTFATFPDFTIADNAVPPFSYSNGFGGNIHTELRVKAYDYPGVDDRALSVFLSTSPNPATSGIHMFDASGNFVLPPVAIAGGTGVPQWAPPATGSATDPKSFRNWSTPWLAATEPTSIEPPSWVTGVTQTLSPGAVSGRTANPRFPQRLWRDWAAISNLAPSGNFVNLVNLRNNYDAESGFGTNSRGAPRMSSQLVLFTRQPVAGAPGSVDAGYAAAAPLNQLPDSDIASMLRWDGSPARLNRPADWTNNQAFMFRPMVDLDYAPSDPRYLFNSYADVDGDGYADSRWFELKRVRAGSTANDYISEALLSAVSGRGGGEMRYFVAARIIDNSSMVNVNTATDFHRQPTLDAPPGLTPADVDLRRLLTLYDSQQFLSRYQLTAPNPNLDSLPYGFFPRSTPALPVGDYSGYVTSVTGTNENFGYGIGVSAYAALRDAISRGTIQAGGTGAIYRYSGANQANVLRFDPLTATERARYFDTVAGLNGAREANESAAANSYNEQLNRRQSLAMFTLSDELELRVRNGLNDDQNTSRLEAAVGGRGIDGSTKAGTLSPLRDNVSLVIERFGLDWPIGTQQANDAALRRLVDPRKSLTTISGARPIVETSKNEFDAGGLKIKLDVTPLLARLRAGGYEDDQPGYGTITGANTLKAMGDARALRYDAIRQIFTGYVDALAPFANKAGSWQVDPSGQSNLAYGGSTEHAMRVAMHLALNLADSFGISRAIASAIDANIPADANGAVGNNRLQQKLHTDDDQIPTAMVLGVTKEAVAEFENPGADRLCRLETRLPTELQDLFPWPGLFCVSRPQNALANAPVDPSKHASTVPSGTVAAAQLLDTLGNGGGSGPVSGATGGTSVQQPAGSNGDGVQRVIGFGIKPQPFLTEVEYFVVLADAPEQAGGDKDGNAIVPAIPGPTALPYITIRTKRDVSNADFVCEILTFTLQNPFDERVYLYRNSGMAAGNKRIKPRFYLEYANRFYVFAQQIAPTTPGATIAIDDSKDVVLEPGETKTFYAMNPGSTTDLGKRISNLTNGQITDGLAWLRSQLGQNIPSQPLVQVDPRTFEPLRYQAADVDVQADSARLPDGTDTGTSSPQRLTQTQVSVMADTDVLNDPRYSTVQLPTGEGMRDLPRNENGQGYLGYGTIDPEGYRVAMLWRVMREPANNSIATGDETNPNADLKRQNNPNDIVNDLLVDRLRDPINGGTGKSAIADLDDKLQRTDTLGVGDNGTATWDGGGDNAQCSGAGPSAATLDNVGYVVTVHAGFGRPYDPDASAAAPSRGYLPAWCIESKLDRDDATTWNSPRSPTGVNAPWSLNWSEKKDSDLNGGINRSRGVCNYFQPADRFNTDTNKAMHIRSATARQLGFSGRSVNEPQRPYRQTAAVYVSPTLVGTGNAERTVLNPGLYSRAGDFLLPLAIGPEYVPGRIASQDPMYNGTAAGTTRLRQLENQWLTLSEALAMGSGYYSPADPAAGGSFKPGSSALQYNYGNDTRQSSVGLVPIVPKVERGGLVIDAWAPYIIALGSGSNRTYVPLRSGAPLALGIFDQFRVAPGASSTDGRGAYRDAAYGGLTTVVPGTINLNTAPPSVLRLLPLVSPEAWGDQTAASNPRAIGAAWTNQGVASDPQGRCCFQTTNWGQGASGRGTICQVLRRSECQQITGSTFQVNGVCNAGEVCGVYPDDATQTRPSFPSATQVFAGPPPYPRPSATETLTPYATGPNTWSGSSAMFFGDSAASSWDIAPTIAAYRDKNVSPMRPVNRMPTQSGWSTFLDQTRYSGDGRLKAFADLPEAVSNGVFGAREELGFKSFGEVLMANQYKDTPLAIYNLITPKDRRLPFGPDQTGGALLAKTQSVQRFGVRPGSPLLPSVVTGQMSTKRDGATGKAVNPIEPAPIQAGNTLASRIAVANAMSNIATVRSDIFTAYFLVYGYTRGDVEGLTDDQPMVPSLAKRFVMVIDRSNVVRPGDKAKVLLFKEVPLD